MSYPPEDYDRNEKRERIGFWVLIVAVGVIIACQFVGCTAPKNDGPPNERITNDATVFLRGTLSDPEVGWEYSRNDSRLNVGGFEEAMRLRAEYMRHLNVTIRSTDRQTTHRGLVCDRFTSETRIDSK